VTTVAEPPVSAVIAPNAEVERIFAAQHARRGEVALRTAAERAAQIHRLEKAVYARRAEIRAAMWADYRKPATEVDLSEIYPIVTEARYARRHLRRWMRPKRVSTPLHLLGSRSSIVFEPKGVVLIIAPWNFPFNLTFGPLVSAIAAGNCAILKPSELTPASSAVMRRIISDVFDESEVAVIEGDASVAQALLEKKFDHIFFTGSPAIGRVVMKAASAHLTPVTLELGGKSPAIVDASGDVGEAARKIAWGKFLNCGQVCIAPDYVLVDEKVRDEFLQRLRLAVDAMGVDARGLIVNERHASRIQALVESAVATGANVVMGGTREGRDIEPTVITDVPHDAALMREEIFGPVLPVLSYRTLDEAFRVINEREKPLVLYAFTRDRDVANTIIRNTRAGATTINHTLIHFYQPELPFGGVGTSGMGKAHGFHGFEAFSNARGVLDQRVKRAAIDLLYPPYGGFLQRKIVDFMLRWM
jgi:aldehyde dehydrogenase (NAD+)